MNDVGPVRRRLAGGLLEFQEGAPSIDSAGETATEGEGVSTSVRHVLLGSGTFSLTFGGRDLGFVGGDVPASGGGARRIPKIDNGKEGSAT